MLESDGVALIDVALIDELTLLDCCVVQDSVMKSCERE